MLPLGIMLALLSPVTTSRIAAGCGGAAVLLARPRWTLYLLAVSVPYQSLIDLKYNNVSVSITEGMVVLLLIGWMTQVARGKVARPARSPVVVAVAVLLVALSLSVLRATNLSLAAKELLKWVELASVCVVGTSLLQTPRQRRTLLIWLIGAAASQAVLGLVQSGLRIGPPHFLIGNLIMRAYGTFEQPNPFGGYLGLSLPLAVALYVFGLRGRPRRVRQLALAAMMVIGAALVITLSRGAWAGQVVGLLLVAVSVSRTVRHASFTFGTMGLLLMAGVWPLLPPELSGRIASVVTSMLDVAGAKDAVVTSENWAVLERLSQWYAGWQMFRENPILGVGIGNYNAAYEQYRLDQWPVALGHAHNHYLTIAAEAGLLGLLAYVAFWAVTFRHGARAASQAPDVLGRTVAVGILGCFAAFCTHNLFDVLFVHGMGVTISLELVLLHGALQGMEDPPSEVIPLSGGEPAGTSRAIAHLRAGRRGPEVVDTN